LDNAVLIKRTVIDSILSHARTLYPREAILLLKGKADRHGIVVNDTQIPPLATHGNTFSTFPIYMLPIDFSIVGVAHSHPSGTLYPSVVDLNKFYGRIMVIAAFPYRSENDVAIFNREGKILTYEAI
jgi:proteasome lid subunit RPN8/RPN11